MSFPSEGRTLVAQGLAFRAPRRWLRSRRLRAKHILKHVELQYLAYGAVSFREDHQLVMELLTSKHNLLSVTRRSCRAVPPQEILHGLHLKSCVFCLQIHPKPPFYLTPYGLPIKEVLHGLRPGQGRPGLRLGPPAERRSGIYIYIYI